MSVLQRITTWMTPGLDPPGQGEFAALESEMSGELKQFRRKFEGQEEVAKDVAANLKVLSDWQLNRARHAESRAATVQGSVAIAASLIFAGASLSLDRAKVNDSGLRWALAALAGAAILAFVLAALRAMQADMKVQPWTYPDLYSRTTDSVRSLTPAEQAGEYGNAVVQNERIVKWKLDRLGQARWHFRNALVVLGVLAIAVLVTVVADTSPTKTATQVEIVGKSP